MMDDINPGAEEGEEGHHSNPLSNSSSNNSSSSIGQMQTQRRNTRRMSTRSQLAPEPRSVTISIPQDTLSSTSSSSSSASTAMIDKQQLVAAPVQESHAKGTY